MSYLFSTQNLLFQKPHAPSFLIHTTQNHNSRKFNSYLLSRESQYILSYFEEDLSRRVLLTFMAQNNTKELKVKK